MKALLLCHHVSQYTSLSSAVAIVALFSQRPRSCALLLVILWGSHWGILVPGAHDPFGQSRPTGTRLVLPLTKEPEDSGYEIGLGVEIIMSRHALQPYSAPGQRESNITREKKNFTTKYRSRNLGPEDTILSFISFAMSQQGATLQTYNNELVKCKLSCL